MSRDVIEPWATAMVAAKLVDPRNGRPSMRALATAAGTTASTISHMMYGTRATKREVLESVIVALRMTDRADIVEEWVGRARTQVEPFKPHPDANLLTSDEQKAVNEIIRLMALSKKRGGEAGLPHSSPGVSASRAAARLSASRASSRSTCS